MDSCCDIFASVSRHWILYLWGSPFMLVLWLFLIYWFWCYSLMSGYTNKTYPLFTLCIISSSVLSSSDTSYFIIQSLLLLSFYIFMVLFLQTVWSVDGTSSHFLSLPILNYVFPNSSFGWWYLKLLIRCCSPVPQVQYITSVCFFGIIYIIL